MKTNCDQTTTIPFEPKGSPSDKLLTTQEAATLFGVSVAFLERDRWSGPTIPFVRVGRAVRYRDEDLRSYIQSRTVAASS